MRIISSDALVIRSLCCTRSSSLLPSCALAIITDITIQLVKVERADTAGHKKKQKKTDSEVYRFRGLGFFRSKLQRYAWQVTVSVAFCNTLFASFSAMDSAPFMIRSSS